MLVAMERFEEYIGYAIVDIDSDGTEELLIGSRIEADRYNLYYASG